MKQRVHEKQTQSSCAHTVAYTPWRFTAASSPASTPLPAALLYVSIIMASPWEGHDQLACVLETVLSSCFAHGDISEIARLVRVSPAWCRVFTAPVFLSTALFTRLHNFPQNFSGDRLLSLITKLAAARERSRLNNEPHFDVRALELDGCESLPDDPSLWQSVFMMLPRLERLSLVGCFSLSAQTIAVSLNGRVLHQLCVHGLLLESGDRGGPFSLEDLRPRARELDATCTTDDPERMCTGIFCDDCGQCPLRDNYWGLREYPCNDECATKTCDSCRLTLCCSCLSVQHIFTCAYCGVCSCDSCCIQSDQWQGYEVPCDVCRETCLEDTGDPVCRTCFIQRGNAGDREGMNACLQCKKITCKNCGCTCDADAVAEAR